MRVERTVTEPPSLPVRKNFATGAWTLVLRGRFSGFETGTAAMERLCDAYFPAVEEFLIRWNGDRQWAKSRAQEFVAHLSNGSYLRYLHSEWTHFRNFLLEALQTDLIDGWNIMAPEIPGGDMAIPTVASSSSVRQRTSHSKKLGGISMVEERGVALVSEATRNFNRKWAITAIERTIQRMEVDREGSDSPELYVALCEFLSGSCEIPFEQFKIRFGLSEGATKVALQRLRFRFVEFLRAEIRETVQSDELVSGEIETLREFAS